METKNAVLVIKGKADRPGLRKAVVQAATMGKYCNDYAINGYIVVPAGKTVANDICKQVKKLRAENRIPFDYLLIYAPNEVAKSKTEFATFCWQMEKECRCMVKWLKYP